MRLNNKIMLGICIAAILLVTSAAYASEKIDVTSGTYYFHGTDEPAFEDGYYANIEVDGEVYYFDDDAYDAMCEYDNNFAKGLMVQFGDHGNDADIKNILGMKVGSISGNENVDPFTEPILKSFSFEYEKGTVGYNKDANIINKVYDSEGKELT